MRGLRPSNERQGVFFLQFPRPVVDFRSEAFGASFGGIATRGVAAAIIATIIIGALFFGREVFVPIALAILLSFVLAPLVGLLQRWHIPRGLSVVSVVLLAFMSIFALGSVIATQVTELAGDLPSWPQRRSSARKAYWTLAISPTGMPITCQPRNQTQNLRQVAGTAVQFRSYL